MLKINSLREALTRNSKWCRANPESFTVLVSGGSIETTGETPSFMYRYDLVLFIQSFSGQLDEITLPLMAWLWQNQPQLLLNPERNKDIQFTSIINNDDTVDLLFEMPLHERVKVSAGENGAPCAEHLPEPRPRLPVTGDGWGSVFADGTGNTP